MIERVVLNDRSYWRATVGDKSRLFDMDKLDVAHDWACKQLALDERPLLKKLADAAKAEDAVVLPVKKSKKR